MSRLLFREGGGEGQVFLLTDPSGLVIGPNKLFFKQSIKMVENATEAKSKKVSFPFF